MGCFNSIKKEIFVPNGHCNIHSKAVSKKTSVNSVTQLVIIIVEILIVVFEASFKNCQKPKNIFLLPYN